MHFNVIIGNPPYQTMDAGESTSASPLYHKFVDLGKQLNPDLFSLIIPSRWMSGGKNLKTFRDEMLKDKRLKEIVDYHNADDCFPGVTIEGGVCYFLWDKDYQGPCTVKTILNNKELDHVSRHLNEFPVFVRFNTGAEILRKVRAFNEPTLNHSVSSLKPFGLRTFFKDYQEQPFEGAAKLFVKANKIGWITPEQVLKNKPLISKYKVLVGRAYGASGAYPRQVLGQPVVAEPNSACTETFLILKTLPNKQEADNLASYVRTRFFRFMVALCKISQDNPKDKFIFVPDLDYTQPWTDEKLFKKYNITTKEQLFIKTIIR